eukprot:SAG31_NODE_511_length_14722_cov_14.770499_14_plen_85_part_00
MADTLESATMEAKPLGTHHQEQIASFLRFAAYKRDQQVKEINVIFDEMIEDRCARLADLCVPAEPDRTAVRCVNAGFCAVLRCR